MSVYKIVQKIPSLSCSGTATTTDAISLKTGILRIVPEVDANIEIGSSPVAISSTTTAASIFVKGGTEILLKESAASQSFVGFTTGTTTTITFPQGQFSNFASGDVVSITGISTTGVNTTAATVSSVNLSRDYDYGGSLILSWNTSGLASTIAPSTSTGTLRKITKVSALAASGKVHITEIQIVGG